MMDNDDQPVFQQPADPFENVGQAAKAFDKVGEAAQAFDKVGKVPSLDDVLAEPVTLGAVVRARRRDLELTQVQLAELAGVSEGSIRNIEDDAIDNPRPKTWDPIQAVLGWAPGSPARIRNGMKPVEILPSDVLMNCFLMSFTMRELPERDAHLVSEFVLAMSISNKQGEVRMDAAATLMAMYSYLNEEPEDPGEAGLSTRQQAETYRYWLDQLKSSLKIAKEETGGEVKHTRGRRTYTTSDGVFSLLEPKVQERTYRLPRDIEEALSGAQVIDYGYLRFSGDAGDNVKIISLLIKQDPDRAFTERDINMLQHFQKMKSGAYLLDEEEDESERELTDEEAADYYAQQEIDRIRGK